MEFQMIEQSAFDEMKTLVKPYGSVLSDSESCSHRRNRDAG